MHIMFGNFFSSPLWQVIVISDWVSKYIILLGLLIVSIVCTAIIIYKYLQFKKEKTLTIQIVEQIKKAKTLSDIAIISKSYYTSTAGNFLAETLQQLKEIINHKNQRAGNPSQSATLTLEEVDTFEMSLNQQIDSLLFNEEVYLPVLGTSAAVSPLIGLFGTVWGLIHSFVSISQEKSADIATVAPGIAAALLTTLAGLVVAIPTMIAFHYFSNELRKREGMLLEISDAFILIVKQSLTR